MVKYLLIAILSLSTLGTFAKAESEVLPWIHFTEVVSNVSIDNEIEIYPNPARSFTTIKVSDATAKIKEVAVYSLLGNAIYQKSYDSVNQVDLNVQSFKKGKYIIKVTFVDNTSIVKTLIKQ